MHGWFGNHCSVCCPPRPVAQSTGLAAFPLPLIHREGSPQRDTALCASSHPVFLTDPRTALGMDSLAAAGQWTEGHLKDSTEAKVALVIT